MDDEHEYAVGFRRTVRGHQRVTVFIRARSLTEARRKAARLTGPDDPTTVGKPLVWMDDLDAMTGWRREDDPVAVAASERAQEAGE